MIFQVQDVSLFSQRLHRNLAHLQRSIALNRFFKPKSLNGFLVLLERLHFGLFTGLPMKDIGKFRSDRVWFDLNNNKREGAHPAEIKKSLSVLWNELLGTYLVQDELSRDDLIFVCSAFMSHFFRIHPFRDGNGRVARNFVKIVMFYYGYEIYYKHPKAKTEARYHRRYVKALRYSHRQFYKYYDLNSYVSIPELKRMNKFMINFLEPLISEKIPDSSVEVEPDFSENISVPKMLKIYVHRLISRMK